MLINMNWSKVGYGWFSWKNESLSSLYMRHFFISIFTVLISFMAVSCKNAADRQMDEIEKVLSLQPSAALEQLSAMDSGTLRPEKRRARHALLLSLAQDKSYIDVTDDSLIQVAVRYYKDYGKTSDRMLAFYSLGRVQYNSGNGTEAIISFLRAKELSEAIPDLHYYGLSTRNIAELYGLSYDYDNELFYYIESSRAFDEAGERFYSAYSQLGEARAKISRGEYEIADSLLQSLDEYARKEQANYLLASVLRSRALIQMRAQQPRPEKVLSLSREAEQLGFPPKYVDGYGVLALAFEYLNQPDSVSFYIDKAEKCTATLLDSIQLSTTKYRILDHRRQYREANSQLEKAVDLRNRLVFNRENQQIANAISAFSKQEADRQALVSRHRLELLVLSIVTALALMFVMMMALVNRKRQLREKTRIIQENEKRIEEDMAQIQEISEALQVVRDNQSEMARAINELMAEKIAIVKKCADAYESINDVPKDNHRDPYHYLDEDPVKKKTGEMRQFLRALDDFRKDESLFSLLEESVNRWRNNIMQKLRSDYSEERWGKTVFSEEDFKTLMLFYAGIPDRTIAFLLSTSCAAVRTRKSRYKDRFAQNDMPQGDYYIKELANSPYM